MRAILLVFICFCFTFLPANAQQKSKSSIDSIFVTPQLINPDTNAKKVVVETYFEIINNSCREICIQNIRASCSCISLTYDDRVIASGERRKVLVELNNTNPSSHYYIYLTVFDKSENKGRTLLIKITGKHSETNSAPSDKTINITPSVLVFKNTSEDDTSAAILEIKNQGQKDIFIRQIMEPCTCISVEYDKGMIEPGETKKVKVKFTGRPDPVEFDMMVMLSNSSRPYIVKIKN